MQASLLFTTHPLRRMLKHGIRSEQIREVLERGETNVITAYEPDPGEWEADFRTRKRRR